MSEPEKVVVVTGASSGLGSGLARTLDRSGAAVVMAARRRNVLEEIATGLSRAEVVECDLECEADRRALIETTVDRCGRIDGLVNNAAASNIVPALEESVEDFRRLLETNLVAPFELSTLAAARMRETGGGSIVNIASVAGLRATGAAIPQAGYCASKGGLVNLTRELAAQWGADGIRVNALAPGLFRTEMVDALLSQNPDALEVPLATVPISRPGEQSELDAAVLFLLGDASSYITGQVLPVDGGFTVH